MGAVACCLSSDGISPALLQGIERSRVGLHRLLSPFATFLCNFVEAMPLGRDAQELGVGMTSSLEFVNEFLAVIPERVASCARDEYVAWESVWGSFERRDERVATVDSWEHVCFIEELGNAGGQSMGVLFRRRLLLMPRDGEVGGRIKGCNG